MPLCLRFSALVKRLGHFLMCIQPGMDCDFCLGCDTQTKGSNYCSESCRQFELKKTPAPTHLPCSTSPNAASSSLTVPVGRNPVLSDVRGSALAEEDLRAYNKMLKEGNGFERVSR
jgi:hypothetical protein